jgi:hypothetical protein
MDPSIKHVQCPCRVIRDQITSQDPYSCSRLLLDECNGWGHHIWPQPSVCTPSHLPDTISLDKLLMSGFLQIHERLKLAVQLASGVMQLHDSAWLSGGWGKRDVLFLQKTVPDPTSPTGVRSRVITDQPFLWRTCGTPCDSHQSTASITDPNSTVVQYDRTLCSLGVILVELWFECAIERYRNAPADASETANVGDDTANVETAESLIGKLMRSAGDNYAQAVSRCIGGLKCTPTSTGVPLRPSLLNSEFKTAVYTEVVSPLEATYKVSHDYCISIYYFD